MKILRKLAVACLALLVACGGVHAQVPPPAPAIFVHGGGWVTGSPTTVSMLSPRLAAWGYVLDTATYRLIPDVTLADEVADVQAEIDRVRAMVAGGPMIVVGHSAGAHLAAAAVLTTMPPAPVCLILLDGIGYDLPALLAARAGLQVRLTLTPEQASPWSPVHLMTPSHPVRMFIAAGNDARGTKEEAERLAAAATAMGLTVESHYYPDMDHVDFLQHFRQAPPSEFLKAVARFVRSCAPIEAP